MGHATDIVGYTYQAETLCIACTGKRVHADYGGSLVPESPDEIDTVGRANDIDVDDIYSYDSDHFPKVVFRDQLEGDRCGDCGTCLQCEGWGCEDCTPRRAAAIAEKLGIDLVQDALPRYAFPGAYPIAYVADDGEYLCANCAGENGHVGDDRDGWQVIGFMTADMHDVSEGPWVCSHCAAVIDPDPADDGVA